jgi:uncharacterized protein YbjQ (UPF0145 family)
VADLIVFLLLLALGYGFGTWAEQRHFRSIERRERALARIPALNSRMPPPLDDPRPGTALVTGSVVVSVDYFKRFLASVRAVLGGRMVSYESLLERARREALLRMKEQARRKGAALVCNVKLQTASISKGEGDSIGSVEVLAYGTALIPRREPPAPRPNQASFGRELQRPA